MLLLHASACATVPPWGRSCRFWQALAARRDALLCVVLQTDVPKRNGLLQTAHDKQTRIPRQNGTHCLFTHWSSIWLYMNLRLASFSASILQHGMTKCERERLVQSME